MHFGQKSQEIRFWDFGPKTRNSQIPARILFGVNFFRWFFFSVKLPTYWQRLCRTGPFQTFPTPLISKERGKGGTGLGEGLWYQRKRVVRGGRAEGSPSLQTFPTPLMSKGKEERGGRGRGSSEGRHAFTNSARNAFTNSTRNAFTNSTQKSRVPPNQHCTICSKLMAVRLTYPVFRLNRIMVISESNPIHK